MSEPLIRFIGLFHPIFLHFPIVLYIVAFICDLLAWLNIGHNPRKVGSWMIIFGTLGGFFTIATGLAAANYFEMDFYLYTHRLLGFITIGTGVLVTILRSLELLKKLFLPHWLAFTLSLILVCFVAVTSDFGGLLTWGETPLFKREVDLDF